MTASVGDFEPLARFIVTKRWIRNANRTVKAEAFMPPSNLDLSVTRHLSLSSTRLWEIGEKIVAQRSKTENRNFELCGRADIVAKHVAGVSLVVEATPLLDNPNHASIRGWPADKPLQMILAQELAAVAELIRP